MSSSRQHAHSEPTGQKLVDAARGAVEAAGEQWTDLRAATFDVIAATPTPLSAYAVTDALSVQLGRRVPANSVYRILDLFVGAGAVQRIESANAFVASAHPGCRHDCMYFVCAECKRATHMDDDRLARRVRSSAASTGFKAERSVIEVSGLCKSCSD